MSLPTAYKSWNFLLALKCCNVQIHWKGSIYQHGTKLYSQSLVSYGNVRTYEPKISHSFKTKREKMILAFLYTVVELNKKNLGPNFFYAEIERN